MTKKEDNWCRCSEAAKRLGKSRARIYQMIHEKKLHSKKKYGHIIVFIPKKRG